MRTATSVPLRLGLLLRTGRRLIHAGDRSVDEAIVKAYHVIGKGSRCAASSTTLPAGHGIRTDTPKMSGGADTAAEPVETLLAALIGCEQATAHFVGRMLGIRLESIDFELRAERDARGSMHTPITEEAPVTSQLTKIAGSARCRLHKSRRSSCSREDINRLGSIVHRRCPIATMITNSGCALDIEWILDDNDDNRKDHCMTSRQDTK